MRIVFLLPVSSQPRYHKRVQSLVKLGVDAIVCAFERAYYSGMPWPQGYRSLGSIKHGDYWRRLVPLAKAMPVVRAEVARADAIYAFGLDMLLLGWLASATVRRQVKIVYEIGDIRDVFLGDGPTSCIMRWLERSLIRHARLVVVTSPGYITGYFHGVQRLEGQRFLVIENKLDASLALPRRGKTRAGRSGLCIGYFGVIRCRRSWEILKRAAQVAQGRVRVYVRGVLLGLGDLESEMRQAEYVEYGGPYAAPTDLPAMYERIDLVWACYPYQTSHIGNWRWARTNRFYEACYFATPMVAQAGTEDGLVVEAQELGVTLDMSDIDTAVARIVAIQDDELASWGRNLERLPPHAYLYTDEHVRLLEAVR